MYLFFFRILGFACGPFYQTVEMPPKSAGSHVLVLLQNPRFRLRPFLSNSGNATKVRGQSCTCSSSESSVSLAALFIKQWKCHQSPRAVMYLFFFRILGFACGPFYQTVEMP